jgi:hypothetical protein
MLRAVIRASQIACVLLGLACNGKSELPPVPAQPPAPANPPPPVLPSPRAPPEAAPGQRTEQIAAPPPIDFTSPESAMAVFSYAMKAKDTSLLLDCFAKGGTWLSVNTVEKPWQKTKLTYANLAAGVQPGGDYRGFLFGDDGEDSFRDFFTRADNTPWKPAGNQKFEPREPSPDQPTYVQWKKQGPRYVVSELAFPAD